MAQLPPFPVSAPLKPATDFICREPDHVYREKSKENLGSHALADFRRCPMLFHRKELGIIPDVDRPAYLIGRAAHVLILEGQQAFADAFAVGGPINANTGNPYGSATKAFREWADEQGKPVLTNDQVGLVEQIAGGVEMNATAVDLMKTGIPEGVVRTSYIEAACQIRIDWFSPERGIVDLKTCDDLTWFESDSRRYGYAHQLAFYRAVLEKAAGQRFAVHMIAVEKREPYRCGVWRIGEDVLGIVQQENEEAIRRLLQCRHRDEWPTGYEDIRVFDTL